MDRFDTPASPPRADDTRTLGQLVRDLTTDASALIRQEAALARTEMRRNFRALARDAGSMALWGVIAVVGGLVLVAFLVALLGDLLGNYWLAALIVGVLFVGIGGGMAFMALRRLRTVRVKPEETLDTLRDTQVWAQAEAAELKAALTGQAHADGDGRGGAVGYLPAPATGPRNRVAAYDTGRDTGGGAPARGKGKRISPRQGTGEEPDPSLPVWKRVMKEFGRDDISGQAAKVSYYFFMSLPPLLMAVFALTGIFGGASTANFISGHLKGAMPGAASGLVDQFVSTVVMQKKPGLLSVGLLLALWSASNVFSSLEDTLNVVYGVEPKRSFIKKKLVALGVLAAVAVLFLAGSVVLLAGPKLADLAGLGDVGTTIWNIVQWPLSFLLIAGAFWIIYYVLPEKDQSGCKKTLFVASAISAAIWLLATLAFRIYVSNFGSYSKTYGFIGAVIVLLLWMYVTSMVILLGGEISSEMERTA